VKSTTGPGLTDRRIPQAEILKGVRAPEAGGVVDVEEGFYLDVPVEQGHVHL